MYTIMFEGTQRKQWCCEFIFEEYTEAVEYLTEKGFANYNGIFERYDYGWSDYVKAYVSPRKIYRKSESHSYKLISLSRRDGAPRYVKVSPEDYEYLSQFKWYLHSRYAARKIKLGEGEYQNIFMHREVLGIHDNSKVVGDHINGDPLDNQRENLRTCSRAENSRNQRVRSNNTTGFKGVSPTKYNKWAATVQQGGRRHHIGNFDNPEEAARAYDYYALQYYREYSHLNFPEETPEKPKTVKYTSKYRGVSWCKGDRRWIVGIYKDGKRYRVGSFTTEVEAAKAYNERATEMGLLDRLNKIEEEDSIDE